MTETKVDRPSEDFAVVSGTEILELPFIKKNEDQFSFWSVNSSGNFLRDCQRGRKYGALALDYMVSADFAPLLTWCIMDMPRKKDCTGVEVGFLEFFAEKGMSSFAQNRNQFHELSN